MQRVVAIVVGGLALLACEPATETVTPPTSASAPQRVKRAEDVAEVVAPANPSPNALQEIVAAAPSSSPPPTDGDTGTRIGLDTGVERGEGPSYVPPPTTTSKVVAGDLEIQPQLSSPAIEREARAQIYWRLRRCKGPGGKPPAPESITLSFTLREDGTVDPVSVTATTADEALQATAECVLREFSNVPFEGPVATRRTPARIIITWPSVD
jgi:hypothetical protein